jgi:hypothetical protein
VATAAELKLQKLKFKTKALKEFCHAGRKDDKNSDPS